MAHTLKKKKIKQNNKKQGIETACKNSSFEKYKKESKKL